MSGAQEQQAIERQSSGWLERIPQIAIIDQPSFDLSVEELESVNAFERKANEFFRPEIKKADELHRSLLAKLAQVLSPALKYKVALKTAQAEYIRRKRAEEEAEKARAQAEAEKTAKAEQARLAAEAKKAGASPATVREIASTPVLVAPPPVEPAVDTRGVGLSVRWKGECDDLMALAKAVAKGKASLELLQPNATAINKLATALKGTMKIPGVRFWKEDNITSPRRKED